MGGHGRNRGGGEGNREGVSSDRRLYGLGEGSGVSGRMGGGETFGGILRSEGGRVWRLAC